MILKTDGLERVYEGKTKDVYAHSGGYVLLHSKDTVTGWVITNADGSTSVVEDPGANAVIGHVEGLGLKNIMSSAYYFGLFEKAGIRTHYVASDFDNATMLVRKAVQLGHGLECIVRFFAMGSILKVYPKYLRAGQELHDFFEVTTKDDAAGDPRISKEMLGNPDFGTPMSGGQYEECRLLCLKAANLVREDLSESGLTLADLKFEIGVTDGGIAIIDEVSAGMMRVFNGDISDDGAKLSEEQLADILAAKARA